MLLLLLLLLGNGGELLLLLLKHGVVFVLKLETVDIETNCIRRKKLSLTSPNPTLMFLMLTSPLAMASLRVGRPRLRMGTRLDILLVAGRKRDTRGWNSSGEIWKKRTRPSRQQFLSARCYSEEKILLLLLLLLMILLLLLLLLLLL